MNDSKGAINRHNRTLIVFHRATHRYVGWVPSKMLEDVGKVVPVFDVVFLFLQVIPMMNPQTGQVMSINQAETMMPIDYAMEAIPLMHFRLEDFYVPTGEHGATTLKHYEEASTGANLSDGSVIGVSGPIGNLLGGPK